MTIDELKKIASEMGYIVIPKQPKRYTDEELRERNRERKRAYNLAHKDDIKTKMKHRESCRRYYLKQKMQALKEG